MDVVPSSPEPDRRTPWTAIAAAVRALVGRAFSAASLRPAMRVPLVHPELAARGELMERRGVGAALTRLQLDEEEGDDWLARDTETGRSHEEA